MGAAIFGWLSGAATVGLIASVADNYGERFGHHEATMILFAFEAIVFFAIAIMAATHKPQ